MAAAPLVSIVIDNYNYGGFVAEAIDSALAQTYPDTEVIVVDDGSSDGSREVIAAYGDRVRPLLKENGGQASAFNAGFGLARGEVILFLDADDALLPTAAAEAVDLLRGPGVAKAHWPLWEVDAQGRRSGRLIPGAALPEGDFRAAVIRQGPDSYVFSPTSGNAWTRGFLERVLPMPEREYRIGADAYLCELAPLLGNIKRASTPQGHYRVHGKNNYVVMSFDEKIALHLRLYEQFSDALSRHCRQMGIAVDVETWKRHSWFHRLREAAAAIAAIVPPGAPFILVDDDAWGTGEVVAGRRRIPFLERDGQYWGPPADDEVAIAELERLRRLGAGFMVFAWPAFWWLDHYAGLHRYLRERFTCVIEDERLIAFDLQAAG